MIAHHTLSRPRRLQLGAAVLLTLLLAGCASGDTVGEDTGDVSDATAPADATTPADGTPSAGATPPADPTEDATATGEPQPAPRTQTFTGILGGGDIEGGCFWLDGDDGTRYELIAGTRSDVAIDQANRVVADGEGNVIAREGDAVEVAGVVDEGLATFCQVGTTLVVDSVSAS